MDPFQSIFEYVIKRLQPSELIKPFLHMIPEEGTKPYIRVVGFGKAVLGMAEVIEQVFNLRIVDGVISIPDDPALLQRAYLKRIRIYRGASGNLPDEAALKAAAEIKKCAEAVGSDEILIILISGGGSALLPAPIPPITLSEKTEIISKLSKSGATIQELNAVRKKLSNLKGGKLAETARKARKVVAFILSDVVGDPLDVIASGPTVPNSDPHDLAERVLKKYDIPYSNHVSQVLKEPKVDSSFVHSVDNVIIGNNVTAVDAAIEKFRETGYFSTLKLSSQITGNAEDVGKLFADFTFFLLQNRKEDLPPSLLKESVEHLDVSKPFCAVGGGETTVQIKGDDVGLGGRNQEVALSFAVAVSDDRFTSLKHKYRVQFMSCGTDGIDGPTDAAGAWVDFQTVSDAFKRGIKKPQNYLNRHDSYTFFAKLDKGHINTGHTGTNVADIFILKVEPIV